MFMREKTTTKSSRLGNSGDKNGKIWTPLVTVSGEYGAGVYKVSAELAARLGVKLFDYRTLDKIFGKLRADQRLSHWLDEQQPLTQKKWMKFLFSKNNPKMSEYLPHLVRTIMAIVPEGGVIVGRGAHLILVDCQVFRVKVVAGPKFCAKRIAEREGITVKAAGKLAANINKERIQLVKEIYNHFPTDKTYYDLVLNTEILTADQIVRIVLAAVEDAQIV